MSDDIDEFEYLETVACPHCSGMGEVDCHCGGDLCVCENYGSKSCPVCAGEGDVTEAECDAYEARQKENWEAWNAVFEDMGIEPK